MKCECCDIDIEKVNEALKEVESVYFSITDWTFSKYNTSGCYIIDRVYQIQAKAVKEERERIIDIWKTIKKDNNCHCYPSELLKANICNTINYL